MARGPLAAEGSQGIKCVVSCRACDERSAFQLARASEAGETVASCMRGLIASCSCDTCRAHSVLVT